MERKESLKLVSRIRSDEEYEVQIRHLEDLAERSRGCADEGQLIQRLGTILQDYEKRRFRLGKTATPHSVLRMLLDARKVKQKDVWPLFASKGVASEALNGKRAVSKESAKRLAKFFNVSSEVFL